MQVESIKTGDVVTLTTQQGSRDGIVVEIKEMKAKNTVGRGGMVDVALVMFSSGDVSSFPVCGIYDLKVKVSSQSGPCK